MNVKNLILLILGGISCSLMGVQTERKPNQRCAPILRPRQINNHCSPHEPIVACHQNRGSENQASTSMQGQCPAEQRTRHYRSQSDPAANSNLSRHRRTSSSGSVDLQTRELERIIKNLNSPLFNHETLGVKLIEVNLALAEIIQVIENTHSLRAKNKKFENYFLRQSIYLLALIAETLKLKQPSFILEENEHYFTLNDLIDTLRAIICNLERAIAALKENTNDTNIFLHLEELEKSIHTQIDTLIHIINQQGLPLKRSVRFAE